MLTIIRGETMSKKAASLPMTILVVAIILLIVMVIYLGVFQGLFKKEGGQINCQINNLDDSDGDGVTNLFDKCCNTPESQREEVASDGCAVGEQKKTCPCK